MAYREVHGVEIREVIRRWQDGFSQRRIASGTGAAALPGRTGEDGGDRAPQPLVGV